LSDISQRKQQNIIIIYIDDIRPYANDELDWFRNQSTLLDAVRIAGLAKNSKGKKYSHQNRLNNDVLKQASDLLVSKVMEISKCKVFEDLFSLIEKLVSKLDGIGELYVYDTALRISAKLNILPQKIYLHAGTRTGAQALGFEKSSNSIEVSQLPKWLQVLEPHEIEDVLCIFKERLKTKEVVIKAQEAIKRSWCS